MAITFEISFRETPSPVREESGVASSRMHVAPSSARSASRTPGSAPCRAAACAHACRRAMLTAAVIRLSARGPPRAISSRARHAVGTDATGPNSSR